MCFGKDAYLLCNEELSCLQEESGACGPRDPSGKLAEGSQQRTGSDGSSLSCMHTCHYAKHQCKRPCTGINW